MNDSKESPSPISNVLDPDKLNKFRTEYERAEFINKEVEEFRDEAGIPGLNELRYAGYHLLKAVSGSSEHISDNMTQAVNHCRRASYEASEAGILAALAKVQAFKIEYKMVVVTAVLTDWPEILVDCDNALKAVTNERQNGDDRSIDHNEYNISFENLKRICSRLDHARNDLNMLIQENQKSTRRFVLTVVIAVLALLLTALGIILAT